MTTGGHMAEPHIRTKTGLGTRAITTAFKTWDTPVDDALDIDIDDLYPTRGPKNRYKFALFVEKEGFDSIIDQADFAQRYDLMLFSSKGQSTTATRELVDKLSQR